MQLLIKDLLDYSGIGYDKQLETIDCNKMLAEVLGDMETCIRETRAKINTGRLPVVKGYTELRLVFQNLIGNAIKFRKQECDPVVDISAVSKNNEWLFSVHDNGIGIEPEYFDRIFTIFQKLHSRKEYPGSGIGLAHCKKIIGMHGGRIWVESEPGRGSTFYFTIPI